MHSALAGSSAQRPALRSALWRIAVGMLCLACAAHDQKPAPLAVAAAQSNEPAAVGLGVQSAATELGGAGVLRELLVSGFEPSLLFVPAGVSPRPLVLAAHGAGGGPEWECEYWRRLTRGQAFILCLSGTPLGGSSGGYFFRDHRALNRELIAAEQAARSAEPRILARSGIYAGFSQGATMGTAILTLHAEAFPYGVLIEGFMPWNVPGARQFLRAGGQRVLFACGSKECATVGKTSVHWFQVAQADARLEYAPGAGHTPTGIVMDKVAAALSWLVHGDPHWLTEVTR